MVISPCGMMGIVTCPFSPVLVSQDVVIFFRLIGLRPCLKRIMTLARETGLSFSAAFTWTVSFVLSLSPKARGARHNRTIQNLLMNSLWPTREELCPWFPEEPELRQSSQGTRLPRK